MAVLGSEGISLFFLQISFIIPRKEGMHGQAEDRFAIQRFKDSGFWFVVVLQFKMLVENKVAMIVIKQEQDLRIWQF